MIQLRKLSFLVVLCMISRILCSCQSNTDEKKEQKKYNVLFIAIDDLRTELNCYGAEHIISPNIDKLAADGVMFKEAHVQMQLSSVLV